MDTQQLISDAKLRFSHNAAKAYIKEKYESKWLVADQDGLWKADIPTISALQTFKDDEIILIDTFGNPVKVKRLELLKKLLDTYHTVMKEWYNEWKEIENKR